MSNERVYIKVAAPLWDACNQALKTGYTGTDRTWSIGVVPGMDKCVMVVITQDVCGVCIHDAFNAYPMPLWPKFTGAPRKYKGKTIRLVRYVEPTFTCTLTCNDTQMQLINTALDLLARIHAGQVDEILHAVGPYLDHEYDRGLARQKVAELKAVMFPHLQPGESRGITPDKHPRKLDAWDLVEVIRHGLAWARNPEGGWARAFDKPWHRGSQPMATLEVKKNEQ